MRLAHEFDFIIFEDDAYFFLNYELDLAKKSRSYLGLEADVNGYTGRVIRFDSLSKTVSPGLRLGFLTGATRVVQLVTIVTENIK